MRERKEDGLKSKSTRPKRTPLGMRNRLSFGDQDPNFVYRVINDQDDRLEQAREAGYDFVVSDKDLGDKHAAEGGKTDSRVSKPVGNGIRGYLMRIPKEYYEDDQREKQKKVDAAELAMKPENKAKDIKGVYGDGLTNE
jgi:hypothetical protein